MKDSFDHEWKNTKGIDMNMILKTFPECIQADICLHLNRELLKNCSIFQNADEGRSILFPSVSVRFDRIVHMFSDTSSVIINFQINACSTG
jgi:hypothetical protein